jgi:hypothetical protein
MSDVAVNLPEMPARVLADGSLRAAAPDYTINDPNFNRLHATLIDLCEFIRREGVRLPPEKAVLLDLGEIGRLRKASLWRGEKGRPPTEREWVALETRIQELHALLEEPCRRGFYIRKSAFLLIHVPFAMTLLAVGSLIAAISHEPVFLSRMFGVADSARQWHICCYIVWLMTLGVLGSVAYVAMNALSLEKDITFNIGNRKLLTIRLILGAIFGLILALPFGFDQFEQFVRQITSNGAGADAKRAAMLLMPFVFGFSTTVVLTFIDRVVDAVGVILGKLPVTHPEQRLHASHSLPGSTVR